MARFNFYLSAIHYNHVAASKMCYFFRAHVLTHFSHTLRPYTDGGQTSIVDAASNRPSLVLGKIKRSPTRVTAIAAAMAAVNSRLQKVNFIPLHISKYVYPLLHPVQHPVEIKLTPECKARISRLSR